MYAESGPAFQRKYKTTARSDFTCAFGRAPCMQRNLTERCFPRLKQFRRAAVPYENRAATYRAFTIFRSDTHLD